MRACAAIRGEASVRRDRAGEGGVVRASAGADRLFALLGRDLYLLAEYQHDGWGAAREDSLLLAWLDGIEKEATFLSKRDALERCGGRRDAAAELLGLHRTTLWRKMRRYHIEG